MVRHGDYGVVAMPDDLEVGDALNGVKIIELKPVFALVEVQDDIMAEPAVAHRIEFASSSEAERVVAASAAEAIVSAPSVLIHYRGITIQDIVPCVALQAVVAAASVIDHDLPIAIQGIAIPATLQAVVATTGVARHTTVAN